MPMHFDERRDDLVGAIYKSSDLPSFLCNHPSSSDESGEELSVFGIKPASNAQGLVMRPRRLAAQARAALKRVERRIGSAEHVSRTAIAPGTACFCTVMIRVDETTVIVALSLPLALPN